jgi:hypothetical protein
VLLKLVAAGALAVGQAGQVTHLRNPQHALVSFEQHGMLNTPHVSAGSAP